MSLRGLRARQISDLFPILGTPHDARSCACPACKAERRGKSDRRYAFGLRRDGRGGKCHRCGFSADLVRFAQQVLLDRVVAAGDRAGFSEFCRAAERAGIMAARGEFAGKPPNPQPPNWNPTELLEAQERPPQTEVQLIWDACGPVSGDKNVAEWARSRGFDPHLATKLDIFRTLPVWSRELDFPWIRSWMWATRRAVFPVWSENGELCSLRFRAICKVQGPKSVPPNGKTDLRAHRPAGAILTDSSRNVLGQPYSVGSAVLANQTGRLLLQGITPASWQRKVVISEGEPDFATIVQLAESGVAVFGIWSGAWSSEIARRIPDNTMVCIRVHHDLQGDRYANIIHHSLSQRCAILRSRRRT